MFGVFGTPDPFAGDWSGRTISDGTVQAGQAPDVAKLAASRGPVRVPMHNSQGGGCRHQHDHDEGDVRSAFKPTPERHSVRMIALW